MGLGNIIEGNLKNEVRWIIHLLGASIASTVYYMKEGGGKMEKGKELMRQLTFNIVYKVIVSLVLIVWIGGEVEIRGIGWEWRCGGVIIAGLMIYLIIRISEKVERLWEKLEGRYWISVLYMNVVVNLDWNMLREGLQSKEAVRMSMMVMFIVWILRRINEWERMNKWGK